MQGGLQDALWDPTEKLGPQEEGNLGSASITDACWPFAAHSDPTYLGLLPVQPLPHAVSHSRTSRHP